MESLSDDCQLLIIGSLRLKGQLKLWEATSHNASSRLPNNIIYHWQHKSSWILDKKMLAYLEEHPEQLEGFLSGISGTVQQLELQYIKSYELQRWSGHSFHMYSDDDPGVMMDYDFKDLNQINRATGETRRAGTTAVGIDAASAAAAGPGAGPGPGPGASPGLRRIHHVANGGGRMYWRCYFNAVSCF
ncbi:PREDICTED: uncharacterized protein LOC108610796 isoform X3 [Drosophila arizonae]|uniref:Uncharacterized protein LOC108610796 isoform X3 n=1 Tax=Drosophila arizonae TaxID=7263 RepID=A0ABM1NUG2_DROAR|nr:PREDICTED: uncharacterized protein LOC108610796 isoform X3 [Drosophila arizonae]